MKITVTGNLYSGKSRLAKALAEHFSLKLYSVGKMQREEAAKMNMTINEYNEYVKANNLNNIIDYNTAKVGKTQDNFIFDARMAWNFIPDSIKICLNVSIEEASKRALNDDTRGSVEAYKTLEEAEQGILSRQSRERENFLDLYGVDKQMIDNYDLVINTSNITPEQTFKLAVSYIDSVIAE